jgi:hypothetical protein
MPGYIDVTIGNPPSRVRGLTFPTLREDGSNYPTWEFQAKNLLAASDLLPHIDERAASLKPAQIIKHTTPSNIDALEAEINAYEIKEGYAKSLIFESCPHLLQLRLTSCESVRDMWLAVKKFAVGSNRTIRNLDVIGSLMNARLKDHSDPHTYLAAVRKHFEFMEERRLWLEATGSPISDPRNMVLLSISDTKIYHEFLVPLLRSIEKVPSYQEIIDLVVHEAESNLLMSLPECQ